MDLLNKTILIKKYNTISTITKQEGDTLYLTINNQTKKYNYFDAFQSGGLVAVDPALQIQIQNDINKLANKQARDVKIKDVNRRVLNNTDSNYNIHYFKIKDVYTINDIKQKFNITKKFTNKSHQVITNNDIILISNLTKHSKQYQSIDSWLSSNTYNYTKTIIQKTNKTPKTIQLITTNPNQNIHLFIKISKREYCYVGQVTCLDYTYKITKQNIEKGVITKKYNITLIKKQLPE